MNEWEIKVKRLLEGLLSTLTIHAYISLFHKAIFLGDSSGTGCVREPPKTKVLTWSWSCGSSVSSLTLLTTSATASRWGKNNKNLSLDEEERWWCNKRSCIHALQASQLHKLSANIEVYAVVHFILVQAEIFCKQIHRLL